MAQRFKFSGIQTWEVSAAPWPGEVRDYSLSRRFGAFLTENRCFRTVFRMQNHCVSQPAGGWLSSNVSGDPSLPQNEADSDPPMYVESWWRLQPLLERLKPVPRSLLSTILRPLLSLSKGLSKGLRRGLVEGSLRRIFG